MITAALLLLLIATTVKSEDVITSISGTKVPFHLIQKHFTKQLVRQDLKKNIIYELSDNEVLQGPGLHLDLRTEARPAKFNSSPRSFTVILNGKLRKAPSLKVQALHARDYDVIIEEDSGRVISVTGRGIALAPLHQTHFRGIFVNKNAFSTRQVDLSDDIKYFPEEFNGGSENVTEAVASTSSRQSGGSCASGTAHYVEIAAAYDNTFCALYENKESGATAALQSIFEKTNVAYAENTCIQMVLTHVDAHCQDSSDPYASLRGFSADGILSGFQRIWSNSRDNIARDAAYFFSGFDDRTSVAGAAALAAACSNRVGYGWVEGPSEFIFAHEVGHTLSATHTTQGIMMGVLTRGTPFRFSDVSVRQFINYIDNSARSGCIDTTKPSSLPNNNPPSDPSPVPTSPPRPFPTETPAPVEPPSPPTGGDPSAETCASGFSKRRALICRRRKLGQTRITSSGQSLGLLQAFMEQRDGQFQMNYVVTGSLIIAEYRDVVTTDKTILMAGGDTNSPMKRVDGDSKSVKTTWEADSMPKVSGTKTCCGQPLFMGVTLRICSQGSGSQRCGRISGTLDTRIRCRNICGGNLGGVFKPMSTSQACPSCDKAK